MGAFHPLSPQPSLPVGWQVWTRKPLLVKKVLALSRTRRTWLCRQGALFPVLWFFSSWSRALPGVKGPTVPEECCWAEGMILWSYISQMSRWGASSWKRWLSLTLNLDQKGETVEGKVYLHYWGAAPVQQNAKLEWSCRSQLALPSGTDRVFAESQISGSFYQLDVIERYFKIMMIYTN